MNMSNISIKTTASATRRLFFSAIASGVFLHSSLSLANPHNVHHEATQEIASVEETAFGKPAKASAVTRTIEISMGDDMRFKPDSIDIKQGEVIRFKLKNTGSMPHEMVLGTADEIQEHAEMMKKMPDMQHNDPNMVRVQPGQTGEILWNFDLAGDFQFACLIPGHRDAGMKGTIHVAESR